MKTISKFLLFFGIFTIVFSGCSKDDSSSDGKSSNNALAGNVLKGKISAWTLGTGYTLKAIDENYNYLGQANINGDGSFSLTLGVPSGSLYNLTDYFPSSLSYSDPNSKCSTLRLGIYDINGYSSGDLERLNNIGESEKGYAIVQYMYASLKTSVKGTANEGYYIGIFNLNLKAGWNTVVYQVTNVTETTFNYSAGNTEPSGVIWKFSGE
jgi:hypothetical protein